MNPFAMTCGHCAPGQALPGRSEYAPRGARTWHMRYGSVRGMGATPAQAVQAAVYQRAFGAAELPEGSWFVRNGFWSKWAGPPPCPTGSVLTSADCQYEGVYAEQGPPPSSPSGLAQNVPLEDWVAAECGKGRVVYIDEPAFDPTLGKTTLKLYSGTGPLPSGFSIQGPPLKPVNCPASPTGCPPGMVDIGDGQCQMAPPGSDLPGKIIDQTFQKAGAVANGIRIGSMIGGIAAIGGLILYSRRRGR